MNTTRRTAGLGLLAYGIGTPAAFIASGSPGGEYRDAAVVNYMSTGHAATAIASAYVGAFAAIGLLLFARSMRREVGPGGDLVSGLAVAGAAAAVIGWFLVGGVAVAFAEAGQDLVSTPHPVVHLLTEMSNLVAVCASAFFAGAVALVVARQASLPGWLRTATYVGGVCGLLAAFYFPLFLFWIWAIVFGLREITVASRATAAVGQPLPAAG
ncbi:MAG: hypothetical protein M3Z83_02610 [Actinomycetota bacterium]|nr:hypothetical protein [Actinomycetota bacterium]